MKHTYYVETKNKWFLKKMTAEKALKYKNKRKVMRLVEVAK